jgi:hypothetical protein
VTEAVASIETTLRGMQGQWAEHHLDRVVPQSLEPEHCRLEVEQILKNPQHQWFRQAVLLAMHMRMSDQVPRLVAAMPDVDEETRALLVKAVERLEPWSDKQLAELLAAREAKVVIAALQAASKRPEPPVEPIANLLVAEDPAVRRAALAALPATIPNPVGERLTVTMRPLESARIVEAILALGRCQGSPVVDECLYQWLGEGERCSNAVLEVFGKRGPPLLRPDRILQTAASASQSLGTRARALYCLERAGSSASIERLETASRRNPVLDYFAARALLQARRPAGLQLLLDAVRAADAGLEGAEAAMHAEAKMGARQLLAHLSGTTVAADARIWEDWIGQRPTLSALALPPASIRLVSQ